MPEQPTEPTAVQLQRLWATVTAFRDRHRITCAETVYQMDSVHLDATSFVEACLDVVGYLPAPRDPWDD